MKAAPALLPILRSPLQGDLLALLYLHPDRDYSLSEAAREIGASLTTVHHEAGRLSEAGLIQSRRRGQQRLIRAADTILTRPLTDLLAVTYGPLPVVRDHFTGIAGVEQVHIYGSWAARYSGREGPPPGDVDVLVVGDTDPDDLYQAAHQAGQILRRDVSVSQVTAAAWQTGPGIDQFIDDIKSKPTIQVAG